MGMIGNSLAQGLISGANIQDGTVDTPDIKDSAVTAAKIASAVITPGKLSTGAPTWDTNSNVGVGVSPSSWGQAGYGFRAIDVGNYGALFSWVTDTRKIVGLACNAYLDSTSAYIYKSTGAATSYRQWQGAHEWYNAPSGTAGATATMTQAMTLDASGNLVLGTTASASARLYVRGSGTTSSTASFEAANSSGATRLFVQDDGTTRFFGSSGSETARIDSSGNFLVGSTGAGFAASGRGLIEVNGTSTGMYGLKANGAAMGYFACNTSLVEISTNGAYPLLFTVNGSERARFLTDGSFAIGKTQASEAASTGPGYGFAVGTDPFFSIVNNNASGGNANVYLNKRTSGAILVIQTNNGSTNTTVGTISHNGTNTSYNTSSDYRLKHDIQPMTGALDRVAALKPCTYKWNANGSVGEGFIAHELQAVVPAAVNGKKDAVNEDGSINPQGIDTSYLVATLTAAIQEQQAIIEQMQTRLAALEGA